MSYGNETETLFSTTLFFSGSESEVDDTEQYGSVIDLTKAKGATIRSTFREKDEGTSQTDDMLVRIYRDPENAFDGTEILVQTVNCGNYGYAAGNKRKSIVIDSRQLGRGYYRLGNLSGGGTNKFGIAQKCRKWS